MEAFIHEPQSDKRAHLRFDRQLRISITPLHNTQNQQPRLLTTKNIAAGGVFVTTKQPFTSGTDVMVNIVMPMGQTIDNPMESQCFVKVQGNILRTSAEGIAIRFQKNYSIEFKDFPPINPFS
ncbi:MAG: PilZ domain-containing protein [bacterium]|nr:PilZ domain-containing protein [bacterium]